jgi:putative FmdB family regulatory protein
MPIYEYGCQSCNEVFAIKRPMSEASEPAACPKCGTQSERVVSVFASKSDYKILLPAKDAFRGEKQ